MDVSRHIIEILFSIENAGMGVDKNTLAAVHRPGPVHNLEYSSKTLTINF